MFVSCPIDIKKKISTFLSTSEVICLRHTSKVFICIPVLETKQQILEDVVRNDNIKIF